MSMGRRTRIALGLSGVVGLAAAATAGGLALDSGAAVPLTSIYSLNGTVGTETLPIPRCYNKPVWRAVRLVAPPPAIYARNERAGAGNDYQAVRYRVFVVDAVTGATLASSDYSSLVIAADNAPGSFSGEATFDLAATGNYKVDYRIEWVRLTTALTVVGWVADRAETYDYITEYGEANGRLTSCAVVRDQGLYQPQREE